MSGPVRAHLRHGLVRLVTRLLIAGVVLVGSAVTPTAFAAGLGGTAATRASSCVPTAGVFYDRWAQRPYGNGGYGCAIAPLTPTSYGYYQNFANGQMVLSAPNQGTTMIVSGLHSTYQDDTGQHTRIDFQWGDTAPYSYNDWLIRLDRNNVNQGQWECASGGTLCTATTGIWGFAYLIAPGNSYQFTVEGCDFNGISHTCNQGWTIPVWLWF